MPNDVISAPQIKLSWLVGILAAFGIFVIVGAYSARMTWNFPSYDAQRAQVRYQTLAKVRADENKLIDPPGTNGKPTAEWIDQGKGVVRIPIEQAMILELDSLKTQPPAMCAVIIPGSPAAATSNPAQAPASTNSAPAAPAAPPTPAHAMPKTTSDAAPVQPVAAKTSSAPSAQPGPEKKK